MSGSAGHLAMMDRSINCQKVDVIDLTPLINGISNKGEMAIVFMYQRSHLYEFPLKYAVKI